LDRVRAGNLMRPLPILVATARDCPNFCLAATKPALIQIANPSFSTQRKKMNDFNGSIA